MSLVQPGPSRVFFQTESMSPRTGSKNLDALKFSVGLQQAYALTRQRVTLSGRESCVTDQKCAGGLCSQGVVKGTHMGLGRGGTPLNPLSYGVASYIKAVVMPRSGGGGSALPGCLSSCDNSSATRPGRCWVSMIGAQYAGQVFIRGATRRLPHEPLPFAGWRG